MALKREDLTQAELKEHLHYDPDTGIFIRLKSLNEMKVKIGDVAGGLNAKGYCLIRVDGIQYKAHRLAWLYVYGKHPDNHIDHIDGDRENNKIINLRDVTSHGNGQNRRSCNSNSTSGYLGVSKNGKGFTATIKVDYKRTGLGTYATPEEAHEAYLEAKRRLHSTCTI